METDNDLEGRELPPSPCEESITNSYMVSCHGLNWMKMHLEHEADDPASYQEFIDLLDGDSAHNLALLCLATTMSLMNHTEHFKSQTCTGIFHALDALGIALANETSKET